MIRYYFFLNLSKEVTIIKEPKLKKSRNILVKKAIKKAVEEKVLINIVKDEELNFNILSYIFENRIINLENMHIEVSLKDELIVRYYDGDILEKEITLDKIDKHDLLIKKDKKTKVIL